MHQTSKRTGYKEGVSVPRLACPLIFSTEGVESSLPRVDNGRLAHQAFGDTARSEADRQELDDAPSGVLCGGTLARGTKAGEPMCWPQGLGQALRPCGRLQREPQRAGAEARLGVAPAGPCGDGSPTLPRGKAFIPEFRRLNRPNPYRRFPDIPLWR